MRAIFRTADGCERESQVANNPVPDSLIFWVSSSLRHMTIPIADKSAAPSAYMPQHQRKYLLTDIVEIPFHGRTAFYLEYIP